MPQSTAVVKAVSGMVLQELHVCPGLMMQNGDVHARPATSPFVHVVVDEVHEMICPNGLRQNLQPVLFRYSGVSFWIVASQL